MNKKGRKFRTRGGHRGVVLDDQGNQLFVKFFDDDKATIPASDVAEFYSNTGRGRIRRQMPQRDALPSSEKPCGNCGNQEPHYIGGGHRCSMCDTEYMEGFKGWFFTEMAMQTGQGLALVQNGQTFILFKPDVRARRVFQRADWDEMVETNIIMGVIDVRDNTQYGSMEVDSVWAQPGYGPLMYMIAMTSAGDYGMMPNRTPKVTGAAKNVWQQFDQGAGQDLVTPHDVGADHHKEPYMNQKYTLNQPNPDIPQMLAKGERFFRGDRHGELRTNFIEFADGLLRSEMENLYQNPGS
tara:strand:- start:661 stop:1548 length:888 start_codon:yes stop_codon:yes gene_type:complete